MLKDNNIVWHHWHFSHSTIPISLTHLGRKTQLSGTSTGDDADPPADTLWLVNVWSLRRIEVCSRFCCTGTWRGPSGCCCCCCCCTLDWLINSSCFLRFASNFSRASFSSSLLHRSNFWRLVSGSIFDKSSSLCWVTYAISVCTFTRRETAKDIYWVLYT